MERLFVSDDVSLLIPARGVDGDGLQWHALLVGDSVFGEVHIRSRPVVFDATIFWRCNLILPVERFNRLKKYYPCDRDSLGLGILANTINS